MAALLTQSADGTPISFESFGEGPPLVVVSGALFPSHRWRAALPFLSTVRRVLVVDRRGRGRSGNARTYAPEREVEDLMAVLAAISGPVDLLGHSSGAILSLQTAARAPANLRRLIAYEPPLFFTDADRIAPDLSERLEALLARSAFDAAVETFLREGPRASEAELAALRAGPAWQPLVSSLGSTVLYDSLIQRGFDPDTATLSRIRLPTLFLVGSESTARLQSGARTLAGRLPNAQLVELPGQQHMAMLSAPEVFAAPVLEFLAGMR